MVRNIIFPNHTHVSARVAPTTDEQVKYLNILAQDSKEIVFQCSGVFPFDFFPDRVIIDKNKLTIIKNFFLFSHTFPILIRDILTVKTFRGILFSTLSVEVKGFEQNPEVVGHLWPSDAKKAKEYLMGLVEAERQGVDLSVVPTEQAKKPLRKIGRTQINMS